MAVSQLKFEKATLLRQMTNQKKDLMLRIKGMGDEVAVDTVIDDMWVIYDDDKNGSLDFKEVKRFVKDALATMCLSICFKEE